MNADLNNAQYEVDDGSEPEIGAENLESRADYELLTIQVDDEDLGNFNEETIAESDEDINESKCMVEICTQKEIIDKLLKDSMSIAEASQILDQGFDSEEEELEDSLVTDHAAHLNMELEQQQRFNIKGKKKRGRKKRGHMPAAMTGLMGEANLKLATRQFAEAEKMCLELIRRYPHSPEPFETLAMIYEEQGMALKSVQYWFIAAFLSSNPDIWEKLANLFVNQLNDPQQAVFCYTRAIKADPKNIDLHWSRAKLLEYLGESRRAVQSYIYMLKFLKPDQGNMGIELAIELAKIHHANDNINRAEETLETALKKYNTFVTLDAINLLLEVLLLQENYCRCIEVLIEQNKIRLGSDVMSSETFEIISQSEQVKIATHCVSRENMPLDILAKFSIALIYLEKDTIVQCVIDDIIKEDANEFGDLFVEIAEAFYKNQKFEESINLLQTVLKHDKFNMAAVWLQYAESLAAANQLEEAADAYTNVIQLAPRHSTTRVSLSNILKSLGRKNEALFILDQSDIAGPFDCTVLFERCQMLKERNETEEFIRTAKHLLQRHFLDLRSKAEIEVIMTLKKPKDKHDAINEFRAAVGELNETPNQYLGADVSVNDQWQIFKDLCEILFNEGRIEELETVTFNALGSNEFMKDPELAKEVEFFCLITCIHGKSFSFAYNIARDIVLKQPECARAWNLLCYVISKTDDIRHNKFLLRLSYKYHDVLPLSILNGHNCLAAGSYQFAMAEYTQVFKQNRNDPLISLMLGLTYIHMACQKFSGNKHDLTIKGAALLQTYLLSRGECQESYYNLGRAMHQLNILPQAIHYYKKALDLAPVVEDEEGNFDLTREIAFNLSLVYKKSENTKLIRYYLYTYIKI